MVIDLIAMIVKKRMDENNRWLRTNQFIEIRSFSIRFDLKEFKMENLNHLIYNLLKLKQFFFYLRKLRLILRERDYFGGDLEGQRQYCVIQVAD
ncbi:hypothetical protein QR98_0097230 [Sarcoptes scabiei]|uniref:Uncharacterized protein n=1 Tax=Sarcoptes scabiei TaxID=52283 RepID=A0A132AKQ5_SARSC|nr:hypothetical protein QR98_0097230 [Sarcoptes scabiei]